MNRDVLLEHFRCIEGQFKAIFQNREKSFE